MNKKAFTLIELLVVITIIGILAVGAVSVFTTQLQWARDSTRIGDMKIMETACHQFFNDEAAYPAEASFTWDIAPFVSRALKDPRKGDAVCWADINNNNQICQWYYDVDDDSYNLPLSAFKIGVHFEKKTNFTKKADINWSENDWWIDDTFHNSIYEMYAWAWANTLQLSTIVY